MRRMISNAWQQRGHAAPLASSLAALPFVPGIRQVVRCDFDADRDLVWRQGRAAVRADSGSRLLRIHVLEKRGSRCDHGTHPGMLFAEDDYRAYEIELQNLFLDLGRRAFSRPR